MRIAFGLMIVCAAVAVAGTNQWTNIGPEGGFVSSVAIDPQTPGTLYAATGAGVFKSSDRGASWGDASPIRLGGAYRLVIDPANPGTLYALAGGGKLLRSTDAAVTWSAIGFACSCMDLAIDPLSSRLYLASSEGVVYNSEDAGQTWNAVKLAESFLAASLAVDQRDSGVLYVAVLLPGPAYRPVIFKSTNGGLLWNESDSGLPLQRGTLLTTDPSNSGVLYLSGNGHIFRSLDGGASWNPSGDGLPQSSFLLSPVAVDPQDANTLYVSTGSGIWMSTDRGQSWTAAGSLPLPFPLIYTSFANNIAITVDPNDSRTLYASTQGAGVFKSRDAGTSWTPINAGLRATPITSVVFDPQNPSTIYAGTDLLGLFKSTDRGNRWHPANSGSTLDWFTCGVAAVVVDPQTPGKVYLGTGSGSIGDYCGTYNGGVFKSSDSTESWSDTRGPSCLSALTIDPLKPGTIYAGSCYLGVVRSVDGGRGWTQTGDGLPGNPYGAWVTALTIDPTNPDNLYAGVVEECVTHCSWHVFKSADGGYTWNATPLRTPAPYPWTSTALTMDPLNPSTIYGALLGSEIIGNGGLWKSSDGGSSWRFLLRDRGDVSGVIVDSQHSGTVYATLGDGIRKSTDGGESWAVVPGSSGFRLLALDPEDSNTLYAAGGGSLFTMTLVP